MDVNSLSHTRWECKYHILFAPKFRRKVAYGELKQDIANILSMLCKRKGVEIIEAEICPDHVHMLVRIPPSMSVSNFVGYLKGKSPAAPLSLNVITAARKGSFPVSGNTWIVSLTLISPSCNTRANIPLDGMIHFPIW